ncbi:MAG: DUF2079 domain-containing protein [Anaerolineae bacterium]
MHRAQASAQQSAWPRRSIAPLRGAVVALWVLMLVYAGYFSVLSIRQHDAFLTTKADLGHFDQPIWNTLHGRLLVRTQLGKQLTRLTDHFEPILIPLSLSFVLWDDVRALLVLQSVVVALGALPLFWLARDEVRASGYSLGTAEVAGLALAAIYLLFPALQAANLTEFHAAPFMVAPMLLALYYARQGRYGQMWCWALVVMAVKEEMPLLVFVLGVWLILARREWKHGAALAAVSLLWFGLATFVIVPHFAPLKYGIEESVYFQRYGELGDSPLEVARSLVTRPALVWQIATEPARLRYVLGLLLSAGLILPLLGPEILLLSLPILLANLLSAYEAMYSGVYHYSAAMVPFVMAAAAVGLGRVGRWAKGIRHRDLIVLGLAGLSLAISLVYHLHHGYTPVSKLFSWPEVTDHHRLLEERFVPQIPQDAILSTTAPLFPHLDHRERIHQFPRVEDAGWILLDAGSFAEMHPADLRRDYDELMASGAWCIVDAADGYVLLERRAGAPEGAEGCNRELPEDFYSFARAEDREPEHRVQADFGSVRLLGYDLTSVRQWQRVGVRLYWTKIADKESELSAQDLHIYPFWLGPGGTVLETPDQRPLVEPYWYPTEQWQPGEVVVTEMLPWDIGPEFRLALAVLDAGGNRIPAQNLAQASQPVYAMDGGTWLRMAAFAWVDGQVCMVDEAAALPTPLDVEFGGNITLTGYNLEPAAPGEDLAVLLSWFSSGQALRQEYTVFVHLLDEAGNRVTQGDGVPGYLGALPTTLWEPGVPLLDRHILSLPEDLAAGTYSLLIGWYDPQSGARLLLPSGEDAWKLSEIALQ